jgi:hypothetical protein
MVARFGNSWAPIINYLLLLIRITNTIKIYYKPSQIPFQVIPDAIPAAILAEFEFPSEFRQNRNHNLAGTPAKIQFPWNTWGTVKNSFECRNRTVGLAYIL